MNKYGGMTPIDDARVELEDTPVGRGFIHESPLGRITTVDDCADVAVFLASDLSSSITGHIIPVDCGNHLMRMPDAASA
jgi:3-oxoacyl-[acyl-carrier protein] reductase